MVKYSIIGFIINRYFICDCIILKYILSEPVIPFEFCNSNFEVETQAMELTNQIHIFGKQYSFLQKEISTEIFFKNGFMS
jgi:hypothetical protein